MLFGRKRLKQAAADRLFALSTARVTMEAELGLKCGGGAAIVFKPLSAGEFTQAEKDVEELMQGVASSSGSTLERKSDSFGFEWTRFPTLQLDAGRRHESEEAFAEKTGLRPQDVAGRPRQGAERQEDQCAEPSHETSRERPHHAEFS